MPKFKQAGRLMQFSSVLGKDVLLIQSMEGAEGMSRLFDFHAEVLAEAGTEIDPAEIVGTKATLAISTLEGEEPRYINGLVAALEQTSGDDTFDVYQVHLVPSLWQLTLSANCRIFQSMSLMDIIKKVISVYGLSLTDNTSDVPTMLEYVTQYNESDFNFISRLMEKYGVFYWFDHSDDDNTVVFGSSRDGYSAAKVSMDYAASSKSHDDRYSSIISDVRATAAMVTGRHSYRDYDFVTKSLFGAGPTESAQLAGQNAYEWYGYPAPGSSSFKSQGQSADSSTGNQIIVAAQRDSSDVPFNTFHGAASSRSLFPGSLIEMAQHPRSTWNRDYLVTDLIQHAEQTPSYTGEVNKANPYTAHFTAVESDRTFRPAARTARPRISGPQPALVVGTSGDEIYLDQYGRVKVQFPWDREGQSDENSSAFIRVGQPWAGNGWGTYFWPRIGDEVMVQFMNGDPDDPIVIGSVYNGVNMEKYALPDMGTRTGILTRSSKGGGESNANELRFEDKTGNEQIFINAEKDIDIRIENDSRRYVAGQDSLIVKGAQLEDITGDFNRSVKGNVVEKVSGKADFDAGDDVSQHFGGKYSLKSDKDYGLKVGQNWALDSGMNAYLKGGVNVTIEAGMELTLKGPGGFITIGPAGVAISGTMVMINSGGAAGSGSAPSLTDPGTPKPPDEADDGSKGGPM